MNNHAINYLWWENKASKIRNYAGIAFYNEQFGEYYLKTDVLFGNGNPLYCKIVGSTDDIIRYRVEVVKKKFSTNM